VNLFRADFAGESGARNNIRGDGYFGFDLGLTKRWKMPWSERHNLVFRWEVFQRYQRGPIRCAVDCAVN